MILFRHKKQRPIISYSEKIIKNIVPIGGNFRKTLTFDSRITLSSEGSYCTLRDLYHISS